MNVCGKEILRWRTQRDLSQDAAAARLGVVLATFQGWEQGRHAPRGLALQALLAATALPPR